ncbi:MAG: hypothetical protein RL060_1682 [Bacteroidota bacterium]|jgi:hypothetical protein
MNKLENAISTNTLKDFLLGRNDYFVRDRDWGGHDSAETYYYIIDYLKYNDEEETYRLIES